MRRSLAIFLFPVCVLLAALFAVRGAAAPLCGDVDADGAVYASDARDALRCAVGLLRLSGETFSRADWNADGLIDSSDARGILRASVGLEPETALPGPDFSACPEPVVDLSAEMPYSLMARNLKDLCACFPSRARVRSIGTTADGREILCAVIGSGHGARQIVADVGIHGSENRNPAAVLSVLESALRRYDTPVYHGKTVRELLDDIDLYVIPMLNPDGITISLSGPEGLMSGALADNVRGIYERQVLDGETSLGPEEYLREWKANGNGVDLNRNYLFERTGADYDTGVAAPAGDSYAGDRNAPEAETAAYRGLIDSLQRPAAVLSIHSQGSLIYWDCGQSGAVREETLRLARAVSDATGYWIDDEDSFVGASADWTTLERGIPSVTVETGYGHNPLPLSAQAEIAEDLRDLFFAAAELYA